MRVPLLAVVLVAAVGCHDDPAAARWHVSDGVLRGPDDRAVILRGVNLSGTQKASPYLDDKQQTDYARLRDAWGFNAIRFVMTWSAVEPAEGEYDDAYLDQVADRLAWADASGLSVVLDMHEDIYGEGFGFDGAPRWTCDESHYSAFVPKSPWFINATDPEVTACVDDFYTHADRRQHFIDAWGHVAARLGHAPAVIGFDILNEPSWGTYPIFQFEPDRLLPLYADVVTAVRAQAPDWVAFVEPSSSRNTGIPTSLTTLPFADAMYAPHSYDSGAESGGGFDPTHRQMILDNVSALADEAHVLNAGLWIGEYGGLASDPNIAAYMSAQYDGAGAVAGSTMYWAYDKDDAGYGLLAGDGTEKTALLDALVRPYPERVAGAPIAYAFDLATSTFTFTYTPDPTSALPTDLVVPARAYPAGYHVTCDGCTFAQDGGELHITAPPSGSPATITIQP